MWIGNHIGRGCSSGEPLQAGKNSQPRFCTGKCIPQPWVPERGIGGFGALQIRNTILELRLLININFVEFPFVFSFSFCFCFCFFSVLDRVLTVKHKVTQMRPCVCVEKTVECSCGFNPFIVSRAELKHASRCLGTIFWSPCAQCQCNWQLPCQSP